MAREPVEIVEIDVDYCSLTFGTTPCTASLAGTTDRKCFNTFKTCKDKENYDKTTLTYKFVEPRVNFPKGGLYFPCLKSVRGTSATANIAGSDDKMDSLGKRAKETWEFTDFTYHDRGLDKYAAERISGAAQLSGAGYNPIDRGTFWSKFKARNPNYAGRSARRKTGYIDNGTLTITKTRHFIVTEVTGPDTIGGSVTITVKDVLAIAGNDRAVWPAVSKGQLISDITDAVWQSFDLNPAGIGSEYPASGFAAIGSELVEYTRSGDTVTLTERGVSGTDASSHSMDDTFQISYSPRMRRIDDVIHDILDGVGVPSAFMPTVDWASEVGRWAPTLKLTTDIMKPEGVTKLIGELAILGITIWWDEVDQEIKLLVNRPVDTETVTILSDRNNIISAEQKDNTEDRLTEVIFNTVQIDPSRGVSKDNFRRTRIVIDGDAKLLYEDTKIKNIYCRWLNHGDDATVRVLSIRYLNRFRDAPIRYIVKADIKDDLSVASVVDLRSYIATDDTGELQSQLAQVIMREDIESGHSLRLSLQKFQFDERYGFITENTRPAYGSSTDAQKERGAYFVDEGTLLFGDGEGPYRFS